ncbi:MAG TPA: tripartite tricarboxylate transporter substrate-binding protein [Roseomonas sp.]|jgi:tripartite-type tricarboxylate transporter receptor subunit TctC
MMGTPLAIGAGLSRAASAQQPSLPATISLVVGASPGGTTDTLARDVSEVLREKLGRNVVVENRAGAGGNVAAQHVARSAPDGGTLLVAFTSHTLNAAIMRQVPYRPLEDFTPVALLARLNASVLVVGPSVGETDIAAFVAAARAQPDRYSFAIGGVGSSLHMQTVLLRSALGLLGPELPFRGTAPALVDVVAGHVDAMFAPVDVAGPLLREGRVRPLAVTSEGRLPSLPNVPSLSEAVPQVRTAAAWFGVLGPAGMSASVVTTLNQAVRDALRTPRIFERVVHAGGEISDLTPAQFGEFLARDLALWVETARIGKVELQ